MNYFFKSTPLHKEWLILTLLSKEKDITQRKIAKELSLSVAMVNTYLENYQNMGYINMKNLSSKTVIYSMTSKGEERRKLLYVEYLQSVLKVYKEAKDECYRLFGNIINRGYKNVLLYGAGEVAEILLTVLNSENEKQFNVIGVIDDDVNKIGSYLLEKPIINIDLLEEYNYDAILISSYTHNASIYEKLLRNEKINMNNVIQFFEENHNE